jgi:hypothetical protein
MELIDLCAWRADDGLPEPTYDAFAVMLDPAACADGRCACQILEAETDDDEADWRHPLPFSYIMTRTAIDFGDSESQRALSATARQLARELGRQAARAFFAEVTSRTAPV